jgi:hypothetical protein
MSDFPPVLVAIPTLDFVWAECMIAFMRLAAALHPRSRFEFSRGPTSPAAKRNQLCETFLGQRSLEWILFLDADMQPDALTVPRLLSHGKDIIGAKCFQRLPPFRGCWQALPGATLEEDCTAACEVEWVGTGCLLIHRRVLESVAFPWFDHAPPGLGEDVIFCDKARAKGFRVFMDCGLVCGHLSLHPVTKETAVAFQRTPAGRAMLREPGYSPAVMAAQRAARATITEKQTGAFDHNGVRTERGRT